MEITVEEFEEKYLPGLRGDFVQKTQENISGHMPKIQEKLKKNMTALLEILCMVQKEVPVSVGEIQIALLHTSVAVGAPRLSYIVYGENGYLGKEIMNIQYDAAWLFECWEEYGNALGGKVKELNAHNYIRYEAVQQMRRQSMEFLIQTLYVVCKYLFIGMDNMERYEDVLFTEDFRLTVGEYMDWRKALFKKRPETDIFFNTDKTPLSYGRFRTAVYSHKTFENMDLTAAVFADCEFVHCSFKNVVLNDVRFEGCRMYYCEFDNIKCWGMTIERCVLKKLKFADASWNFVPDINHLHDLYKPAEVYSCELEGITFHKSDIRGIVQDRNRISDVEIIECEGENSWNTTC